MTGIGNSNIFNIARIARTEFTWPASTRTALNEQVTLFNFNGASGGNYNTGSFTTSSIVHTNTSPTAQRLSPNTASPSSSRRTWYAEFAPSPSGYSTLNGDYRTDLRIELANGQTCDIFATGTRAPVRCENITIDPIVFNTNGQDVQVVVRNNNAQPATLTAASLTWPTASRRNGECVDNMFWDTSSITNNITNFSGCQTASTVNSTVSTQTIGASGTRVLRTQFNYDPPIGRLGYTDLQGTFTYNLTLSLPNGLVCPFTVSETRNLCTTGSGNGLLGQYYPYFLSNGSARPTPSNATWTGGGFPPPAPTGPGDNTIFNPNSLVAERVDVRVNSANGITGWINGIIPATFSRDRFTARWQGEIEIPLTGSYRFASNSDDGVRIWVNGIQVSGASWVDQPGTNRVEGTAVNLTCGRYPIVVQYYENTGGENINIQWQPAINGTQGATQYATIPQQRLYAPQPGNPTLPVADIAISKDDGITTMVPGQSTTYTITVSNNGPNPAVGVTLFDPQPANATSMTWSLASATTGASATVTSGTGALATVVTIPNGGEIRFNVTVTTSPSATGTLENTATAVVPISITDNTPGNNSATDINTFTPQADLQISKNNGISTVSPGQTVTYTIVATNPGPNPAPGTTVVDTFDPSLFSNVTWTTSTTGGAAGVSPSSATTPGINNINSTITTFPVGATVTYTVTATVRPDLASTITQISNTATVNPPSGVTDPTPGNNQATDTDTVTGPQADITVTKTDGITTIAAGETTTYTVTVSNNGPATATGVTINDNAPPNVTFTSWTAALSGGATITSGGTSGSGNISAVATMPPSSQIVYTITARVDPQASGSISNTASANPPTGITDPTPGNNSATDTNTVTRRADVQVTKTASTTSLVPGQPLTYTVVVSNPGPSQANGVVVNDVIPTNGVTGISWNSLASGGATGNTSSGTSNINDTLNMPPGSSVNYQITLQTSPSATGSLANTATVTPPSGVTDPNSSNNTATATATYTPRADVQVTKQAAQATVRPEQGVQYTVKVRNTGPNPVSGVTVEDLIPTTGVLNYSWTAAVSAGTVSGFTPSGTNVPINDVIAMGVNGELTYTINLTMQPGAIATLTNTANATLPSGVTDPNTGNNSGTATVTVRPEADLSIFKDDGISQMNPGDSTTYTITVQNPGPSLMRNVQIQDLVPNSGNGIDQFTWTTTTSGSVSFVSGGSSSPGSGKHPIQNTVDMDAGSSITYTVTLKLSNPTSLTEVTNTATVTPPTGASDPNNANNSSQDINEVRQPSPSPSPTATATPAPTPTLIPTPTPSPSPTPTFPPNPVSNLQVSKVDSVTEMVEGGATAYTIRVRNLGPDPISGVTVTDPVPGVISGSTNIGGVSRFTWTTSTLGGAVVTSGSSSSNLLFGTFPINSTVTLPVNGEVIYTVNLSLAGTLNFPAGSGDQGTLTNQVSLGLPSGATDPDLSNNTDSDVNTVRKRTGTGFVPIPGWSNPVAVIWQQMGNWLMPPAFAQTTTPRPGFNPEVTDQGGKGIEVQAINATTGLPDCPAGYLPGVFLPNYQVWGANEAGGQYRYKVYDATSYPSIVGDRPFGIYDSAVSGNQGLCFYTVKGRPRFSDTADRTLLQIDANGPAPGGLRLVEVEMIPNNINPVAIVLDDKTRRPIPMAVFQPLVNNQRQQRGRDVLADGSQPPGQLIKAAAQTVNSILVSGIVPSRPYQPYGGLNEFPRLIEDWGGDQLQIRGSMIQLNFSVYGSAPLYQGSYEPPNLINYNTRDLAGSEFYRPAVRNWGYDVGLQIAPLSQVSKRFTQPTAKRTEVVLNLDSTDPYIRRLRCALQADSAAGVQQDALLNCPS